jgi:hypothetical protein
MSKCPLLVLVQCSTKTISLLMIGEQSDDLEAKWSPLQKKTKSALSCCRVSQTSRRALVASSYARIPLPVSLASVPFGFELVQFDFSVRCWFSSNLQHEKSPHTSGPRDVPRCGALSLLQKDAALQGGPAETAARLNVKLWLLTD